jgi:hypothetical protein
MKWDILPLCYMLEIVEVVVAQRECTIKSRGR